VNFLHTFPAVHGRAALEMCLVHLTFVHCLFLITKSFHGAFLLVKGQQHEIFGLWFFHESTPCGPLVYTLHVFEFGLEFTEIFEIESCSSRLISNGTEQKIELGDSFNMDPLVFG
jgi:hypothetical protein